MRQKTKFRDMFKEDSESFRKDVKRRILTDDLIEYKCDICNMPPVWNKIPMVLILDHKNGINNDNRLSNLRFVCPNCNSQLDTHCGKNKKRKEYKCIDCNIDISRYGNRCKKCAQRHRQANL